MFSAAQMTFFSERRMGSDLTFLKLVIVEFKTRDFFSRPRVFQFCWAPVASTSSPGAFGDLAINNLPCIPLSPFGERVGVRGYY